ncbi:apoptotic chromatin condensation inducer in the nucleus [Pistacia vera]|uniref:apoptotic chromatin condensation inducer in the nucleus-like n=1 Tax=Pistacia vera TaxID=55513 RepID=UPI001263D7BB|nr:apoptotic chromatin condensation inducer in the nucleus-like [Pistacia vera]XP_031264329.1 apoptotic chromatin condensation inducer in the nucleus [Pistacia vera]
MSSPYPILDNKPIDQWKVTELKEELKRRKLKSSGKKEELIRMLDNAIRIEREKAAKEAEADNGVNSVTQPVVGVKDAEKVPVDTGIAKDVVIVGSKENEKVDNVVVQLDMNSSAAALGQGEVENIELAGNSNKNDAALGQEKIQESDITGDTNPPRVEEELVIRKTTVETSTTVTKSLVTELAFSGQELHNSGTPGESLNSNVQLEIEDPKPQLENEGLKPLHKDDILDTAAPDNQVSEVSANLGSQVKSDSISTDSVSINEKIELKDNIIADNVKLEQDVIKQEMVEPSSSNIVPVGGESHPMDVEEPLERKASIEERDDSNATIADMGKKNDSADVGYSEKLNLDRSSGDDSMEEDVLESKQIDSKDSFDEVRDRSEKDEVSVVKEDSPVDVVGDGLSDDKKDVQVENKSRPVVAAEKRKINDQETVGSNEPLKRQRRWNSESLKLPEQQSSNLTPTTTPRDTFQSSASKRNLSRSDSAVSDDTPKERVVPPSPKPPTNSLRIDHFVRPFTLKAVHELLGKTGTFTSFWMDHIKTHCYVTYTSVDEAMETRKALYNIQWPPNNGGRLLVAEFVDPQEVKMRAEAPPQSPAAPTPPAPAPPASQPQPSPRQPAPRQQLPPPPTLPPPPPPVSNPAPARERFTLPPPPPLPEKIDPPIVTLDDLFRKTKATPRIYYLPLSEEQVAAKVQSRSKNTKQSAGVTTTCRKELFQPSLGILFVDGFRFGFSEGCACLRLMFYLVLETSSPYKAESFCGVVCLVFLLNQNSKFYELLVMLLDHISNFWMIFSFPFKFGLHCRFCNNFD